MISPDRSGWGFSWLGPDTSLICIRGLCRLSTDVQWVFTRRPGVTTYVRKSEGEVILWDGSADTQMRKSKRTEQNKDRESKGAREHFRLSKKKSTHEEYEGSDFQPLVIGRVPLGSISDLMHRFYRSEVNWDNLCRESLPVTQVNRSYPN